MLVGRKSPLSCGSGPARDHTLAGPGEPQHITRDLLDDIRMGEVRTQKRDVALKPTSHSFETLDLKLQESGVLDQSFAGLEAVPAVDCVIGEVGR